MKLRLFTTLALSILFITAFSVKANAQDGGVWPRFGRSYTVYAPDTAFRDYYDYYYCNKCRKHLRKYYRHRYWEDRYWENRNYHDEYYYDRYSRNKHSNHYYEMIDRYGRDRDRRYRDTRYYYRGGGY